MNKNSKNQKEELARRLAEKKEKPTPPTKNRLLAVAIDLNGNGMEYKYKRTTVKG
jgi:hypothetical protein